MNRNPRRVLGAVAGAALLLGGAFTAQAVADSGAKAAVVTPADSGDRAAVVTPAESVPQPASKPVVVKPGTAASDAGEKGVPATKSVPAETAPRVITPGE
ncbi:hypothetical protein ABZY68_04485 [Streptomyces sp. NPDC006482]|uniref:hypothetical protein n=1 Tax=Streptomyces sp. NPDC006482 TaxID=3154306 RepID=UPI0033A6F088